MNPHLTGFRIVGLHGRQDISINIEDDCVVLVGVNGLGKTTIINILYYLMTRQWMRLVEYRFDALAIDIGGRSLTLTREQLEGSTYSVKWRRRLGRMNPRLFHLLEKSPELFSALASEANDPIHFHTVAERFRLPASSVVELRHYFADRPDQQEMFASAAELKTFEESLAASLVGQVLYLPTYRRIEKDLENLFPGLEEQIHSHRAPKQSATPAFLEFVEFGMRDVGKRFTDLLATLKDRARSELNNLAASYLQEVIRGEADTYDTSLIASLDEHAIDRILSRVEQKSILDEPDKDTLREVIARLKASDKQSPQWRDRYVGHFFAKLAAIHASLAEAESAIDAFVDVCNSYLVDKSIVFDDRNYEIRVEQHATNVPLELRHLSSGEKQIVSLFTHVYLGEAPDLIVLIDEPELSLSVPWQQQLLPDIRRSGRCRFLAAVTHSPFIYDNEIEPRATDLRECIRDR